ncbi:MAG: hypothetical protein P8Y02_11450, partial [Deinococcales bacterium]
MHLLGDGDIVVGGLDHRLVCRLDPVDTSFQLRHRRTAHVHDAAVMRGVGRVDQRPHDVRSTGQPFGLGEE